MNISKTHPKTIPQIPREMARSFMYSTPHREAILSENYDAVGFGVYAGNSRVYVTVIFCNAGKIKGSKYYNRDVTPAIRHPEWLPAGTRRIIDYTYNVDGTESVTPPHWLDDVETLTPIPNSSDT